MNSITPSEGGWGNFGPNGNKTGVVLDSLARVAQVKQSDGEVVYVIHRRCYTLEKGDAVSYHVADGKVSDLGLAGSGKILCDN